MTYLGIQNTYISVTSRQHGMTFSCFQFTDFKLTVGPPDHCCHTTSHTNSTNYRTHSAGNHGNRSIGMQICMYVCTRARMCGVSQEEHRQPSVRVYVKKSFNDSQDVSNCGHFATTPSPTHYCHCAALNLPTYVHCLYVRTYMCGYVFGIGYQQHANYMLYISIPASVHLYSAVLSVCIPAVYVCTYAPWCVLT